MTHAYLEEIRLRKEAMTVKESIDRYLHNMTDSNMDAADVAVQDYFKRNGVDWNQYAPKPRQRG